LKPNHCSIVLDEGFDVYGNNSDVIGPHGIYFPMEPNKEKMG
jgi:hypothetical protein